jgi:predicted N-acetyltransferase YhbS
MPESPRTGIPVSVREATRADHPAIRGVLRAAYQQYDAELPPGLFRAYLEDLLDLDDRERTGTLLVAERDGRVLGAVTFYRDAAEEGVAWPHDWAGLRALGVDPAAQGQGVGHLLMDACLQGARRAGAEVLCLHTTTFMREAAAMYLAMGFQRVPEYDFAFGTERETNGAPPVRILAYRLDLSSTTRGTTDTRSTP